jgi:hypothetical protein
MTELLRERRAFDRHPFVLIDVGCAGGIDDAWRAFGPTLMARGYDPDVAACEEAQSREPFGNVRYQARYVGLEETHPFVQRRRADQEQWPNTNIWGRVTAGYLAERAQDETRAGARRMADPAAPIGVDEIVRTEKLVTVDFLKVDVDGPDLEVLESAREVLANNRVLGIGLEVNWFGTPNPTEHTFHNTDRFMRDQGFALFGMTCRSYSRTALPAPFVYEGYAQTRFGQPYQGDAIYVRDLAAEHLAAVAADYPPEKLIKLACIYELVGVPDCAAEVLNRFDPRLTEFGDRGPLLDALTPPLLGEQLPYRDYIAQFERHPDLFLPGAAAQPAQAPLPRRSGPGLDSDRASSNGTALRATLRDINGRMRLKLRRAAARARTKLRT